MLAKILRMVAFEGNGCSVNIMLFWLMVMTVLSADSDFAILSWARVGEGDGEESRSGSNTTPDYVWFSGLPVSKKSEPRHSGCLNGIIRISAR